MQPAQVIVLATPVFLALMALELLVARHRGVTAYRWHDALGSIGLGMISQVVGLFTVAFNLGIYAWVYTNYSAWQLDQSAWWVWLVGLVAYDFCYYWLHRMGHEVGILWAAHAVHHQSEDYNLSTALRQTSSGFLLAWLFYLPMAFLGFPPLVFGAVALIDLLYQYWVHTEQIGQLGWFDRVFCSPSNHRAHHAVNDPYLDRNYGGILILFDRWFGTFVAEDPKDPVVYGTRSPLRSFNPLWANLEVYWALAQEMRRCERWTDKLLLPLKPPGWRPPDVVARYPKPPFELALARRRYDPPLTSKGKVAMALVFAAAILVTSWLLWNAHLLSLPLQLAAAAVVIAGMALTGYLGEHRLGFGPAPRSPTE